MHILAGKGDEMMRKELICCPPANDALRFCGSYLTGIGLTTTDTYGPGVTHWLLPVPASGSQITEASGGAARGVVICGGNLDHPLLRNHRTLDFLKDPYYLADNAAITAQCAIRLLNEHLADLYNSRILILGWGRIGKCLGKLLQQIGVHVTIAARKEADLAMIHALGYQAVPICETSREIRCYDAVLNTVPEMVLPGLEFEGIAIELASKPGMSGPNIIPARGLPGKMAPEKSGELIARTFLRLGLDKEESSW